MSTSTTTSNGRHHRKQRFPRLDRRKLFHEVYRSPTPSDLEDDRLSDGFVDDDEVYCKRARLSTHIAAPNRSSIVRAMRQPAASAQSNKRHTQPQDTTSCRLDKRARDEHNEQERSRRRELAVIYELIRCSFSEDDLRYLGQCSGPKSVEKLSYPQVLQIAYQLLLEEQHNLVMFEKSLQAIKLVEKEYLHVGLPIPQRPFCPAIPDSHRKVVQVVDSLLRQDKSARTPDGVYEVTPAERAAIGNHQLSAVVPQPASVDSDLPDSSGVEGQCRPGPASSSAVASHPKSQTARQSSLLITNNGTGLNTAPVARLQRLSTGSSPQSVRQLVSAGSSSSSSRATVHRSAFKLSTSHSDSSSGAGSPRAEVSMPDGCEHHQQQQQMMVFDWLGLRNGAPMAADEGEQEEEEEGVSEAEDVHRAVPPPPRRGIRPPSSGRPANVTWSLRRHRQSVGGENRTAALVGSMVQPRSSRSLVSRSVYSKV